MAIYKLNATIRNLDQASLSAISQSLPPREEKSLKVSVWSCLDDDRPITLFNRSGAVGHGVMGCWIDSSWRTRLAISLF